MPGYEKHSPLDGQRGTVVDYCENFHKYVVEFDILERGQRAKLAAHNLQVVTESDDKENAPASNLRVQVKQDSLAVARKAGSLSPATKEREDKARSGL